MGFLATLGTGVLTAIGGNRATVLPDAAIANLITETPADAPVRRLPAGGAGTRISAGRVEDTDQNVDLRGEKWYGSPGRLGVAGQMLRDPHVRQSIDYIANPICAANWRFKPASKDPVDRQIADFCNWAFLECLPWDQIVRRQIRGYATYGFDVSEMTDDLRKIPTTRFPDHPGRGMGVVPTGIHQRPAWSIYSWIQNPARPDQLKGIEQWVQGADNEEPGIRQIPGDRLIRLTWDQEGANYEGLAVLRSAYQPWKIKTTLITLEAVGFERTAIGTPALTLAEDAEEDDIAAAESILAELRVNEKGYIVLPNGYELEWTAGDIKAQLGEAIERSNRDIAYNVAAGFMLLGLTGKTGSFALGSTQQGQYHLAVESHARFIASMWNVGADGWSPIERIVRLNWGQDVALPRLEARNLPTRNWGDVISALNQSIVAGTVTGDDALEEEIREMAQVGPHDPDTARERGTNMGTPSIPDPTDETEKDEPEPVDDAGSMEEARV